MRCNTGIKYSPVNMEYFFKCGFAFLLALGAMYAIVYGGLYFSGVVLESQEARAATFWITLVLGSLISGGFVAETVDKYS